MGFVWRKVGSIYKHVTEETFGCRFKSGSVHLVLHSKILKEAEKQLLALLVSDTSLNNREIISEKVGAIFKRANEMTWISIS